MTKQETAKLIMLIKASYPNSFKHSDRELEALVDAWTKILEEYDFRTMESAFLAFTKTDTKGYPPVPGQLIALISEQRTNFLGENEAWDGVARALRNGIYGFEEEYEKLDPIVQKCVGSAQQIQNWAMLPSSEVHTIIRSQFIKNYRTELERAKQDAKIPKPVLEVLRKNNLLEAK